MSNPYVNGAFFRRLERESLKLKSDLTGFFGGKHQTKKNGQTVDFADYREYALGDDLRKIDWNLYSRFRKYYIRLFNDERQMQVSVYLDCSASMGEVIPDKGYYAEAICAALGFLAVRSNDKLCVKLIKGNKLDDGEGVVVGTNNFFRSVKRLDNINFSGDSFISDAITKDFKCVAKDGLSVIISDFLTDNDWKKAVDYLIYKGRQVLLVQVLARQEISPDYTGYLNLVDSEADGAEDERNMRTRINGGHYAAYEQAYNAIKAKVRDFCVSRGAGYAFVSTETPIEKAVFGGLIKADVVK